MKYSLLILGSLGLGIFFIYTTPSQDNILTTKQNNSYIETFDILSPESGTFKTALISNGKVLKKNQILGYIDIAGDIGKSNEDKFKIQIIQSRKIVSPCHCIVSEIYVVDGEYKTKNSKLFKLLPYSKK